MKFIDMLSGGHPNSLGRTIEVVDIVLKNPDEITQLFFCYESDNEVVRLRTSNAFKRITRENPSLVAPLYDQFLDLVGRLYQPSLRWTFSQISSDLYQRLSISQKLDSLKIITKFILTDNDWIVLNQSMKALPKWLEHFPKIEESLVIRIRQLSEDERKSVSGTAKKLLKKLKNE